MDRVVQSGAASGQLQAVVTGGANGIGRAITKLFQQSNIRVCVVDCDVSSGTSLAAELTLENPCVPVRFIHADLAEVSDIQHCANEIATDIGRVDILVNNAGIEVDRTIEGVDASLWDKILNINLRSAFLLTQELLPIFPSKGGSIINVSSVHATHAFSGSIPYACSKAGLVALTRNLALELADRRIRANVLLPGYIDTRLWDEYLQQAPNGAELAAQTTALHPVGRRGLPEDVARAALFLVQESSEFINGTELVVDGGLTIRAHS